VPLLYVNDLANTAHLALDGGSTSASAIDRSSAGAAGLERVVPG
jgi:hypothetical protein